MNHQLLPKSSEQMNQITHNPLYHYRTPAVTEANALVLYF